MSWKTETMLGDLDGHKRIELTCKACGKVRIVTPATLMIKGVSGTDFLDQVEAAEKCRDKHCKGRLRLSLSHNELSQPFVGGMP